MVELNNLPKSQAGAVLVVAMVLLLVMSLIGLSSVVSSTLQEKMAGNAQQRALSKTAAESALRAAEVFIATNVNSKTELARFDGTNIGLFASYPVPSILFEANLVKQSTGLSDSSDASLWTAANSVTVNSLSDKVKGANPRYVIEYVGRRSQSGTSVWSPSAPIERGAPHIFRITAIGWARDTNVYSVLQSHFMTGDGVGVFDYEE